MPPDTPRPDGAGEERKVVSVVFADLEASTELATRLDPEDLRKVIRPYFEAMAEEIVRHGGTVEKFIGDAVVGVFGAPIAHEDDPVRAVRAALAMQARLPEINRLQERSTGADLALRVAVHTGEVLSAPGAAHEGLVTGETTTIASRLQGAAPTGTVIVSQRTHRDTKRSVDYEPFGDLELKGVSRPISAWLALGEGGTDAGAFASPLVGRRDELDLLGLLLRRCAKEGRPYVATVVGPAGIGKSRLAREFAEEAGRSDGPGTSRVVRGRCLPYGDGLHLWPLAEILKEDAGILDSDPPETIVERARQRIGSRLGSDDAGSSMTLTLLSSIGFPVGSDPLSGAGREAAERMIADAWSRYFAGLASEAPLVAVIEDVHWADAGLLDLLDQLSVRTPAAVLFVCLARPEVFDRRPGWGSGTANFATLELTPLSTPEGAALVENLLDGEVSPDLVAAITDRAEGNPFFAGELVRMLIEEDAVERRGGQWLLAGDVPAALPDTVQGAIAARIDRLDPADKRAIQDAAVVGRVFWEGALEALGTRDVGGAIDALVARGLVRARPASSIANSRELVFEHALIRDVAYASIPRSRRAEAHTAVLEWIESVTRGRDEEFAELLAHHASLAGDIERTARYTTLAGHRHRRVYAAEDAIRWYDRALAATENIHSDTTTLLVAEITHSRGEALEQLSRFEDAQADYERELAIARGTGRAWMEAQALAALTHILWMQDRYAEGEALLPRALEAAKEAGTQYLEARLLYTAGALAWGRGEWARAQSYHEQALRIATEARDLEGEAYARHGLTDTHTFLGPIEEALAQAERSQELWLALGQRPMANHNRQMLGYINMLLGRLEAADAHIEQTVIGHRELGQRRDEAITLSARVLVELSRGELGVSVATANEAVELARTVDAPRPEYIAVLFRMLVYAELGAAGFARHDLPIAAGLSERIGGWFGPPLVSARGWLELEAGDREEAVRSFGEARHQAANVWYHRLLCGRFEVLAWEITGESMRLRDAGAWLLDAAADSSPPHQGLAACALARADQLDGNVGSANERARAALLLAEEVGDLTVAWRACSIAAAVEEDPQDAAKFRRRASEIVGSMASTLADRELRSSFLGRPDVAALVEATEPPR